MPKSNFYHLLLLTILKSNSKNTPQQCRIIGGQWKRTPLAVIDAQGLRPTPDRVRETVFNWLNFLLQNDWQNCRCLDLFAGTGALGFEAASRGAAHVTLVEKYPPAVQQLNKVKAKLNAEQVQTIQGDALQIAKKLSNAEAQFDLIFLDPPFHRDLLVTILPSCVALLADEGLLYLEAEKPLTPADLPPVLSTWHIIRSDQAGMVFYHLLRRNI